MISNLTHNKMRVCQINGRLADYVRKALKVQN